MVDVMVDVMIVLAREMWTKNALIRLTRAVSGSGFVDDALGVVMVSSEDMGVVVLSFAAAMTSAR